MAVEAKVLPSSLVVPPKEGEGEAEEEGQKTLEQLFEELREARGEARTSMVNAECSASDLKRAARRTRSNPGQLRVLHSKYPVKKKD